MTFGGDLFDEHVPHALIAALRREEPALPLHVVGRGVAPPLTTARRVLHWVLRLLRFDHRNLRGGAEVDDSFLTTVRCRTKGILTMAVLEAIRDVLDQADEIRSVRPDVADRLAADAEQLVAELPALTVHQVAETLSQSKPTIHAWIKAGVLDATPVGRKLLVTPASVLALMPVIREWRAGGGRGRPMRMLREWLATEQQLKAQRQEVGRARRQGSDPLLWPGGRGMLSERTRQRLAARGLTVGQAEPAPPERPAP